MVASLSNFVRSLLVLAAVLLAVATGLGAYASHGLDKLEPSALETFKTAVDYQFFHALGLFGLALLIDRHPNARTLAVAALGLIVGVALFCGGLYASSFGGPRFLAQLAPVGGTALIVSWLVAAVGVLRLGR